MASGRLSTTLGPLELRSPLIAASGTVGSVWEWAEVADTSPYGAAVAKSVAPTAWAGRPAPRLAPTGQGMLNGIGIQNPGVETWVETMRPRLGDLGVEVWGSAVGATADEFAVVAAALADCGVAALEINLSCPNLEDGRMFSQDSDRAAAVITAVRAASRVPIGAKLSPNTDDLVGVSGACLEAGADFLVLTNTALGFGIDIDARRPLLSGGPGGYSGPGLKAISMRCVYEVARAIPEAQIVGCGGISNGADVIEYMMAGASAVGLGTIHLAEPKAGRRIAREVVRLLDRMKIERISELIGVVEPW